MDMIVIMNMKLEDWLRQNRCSVPAFAQEIGVKSVKTVYRYINGERRPEGDIMMRIKQATNNQVTADSFLSQ